MCSAEINDSNQQVNLDNVDQLLAQAKDDPIMKKYYEEVREYILNGGEGPSPQSPITENGHHGTFLGLLHRTGQ